MLKDFGISIFSLYYHTIVEHFSPIKYSRILYLLIDKIYKLCYTQNYDLMKIREVILCKKYIWIRQALLSEGSFCG